MSLCCINLFFCGPKTIASFCQPWGQRGDGSFDPWSILHLWLHQPALPGAHTIHTKVIFIFLKYFLFILLNMFVFQENIHRGFLSDNSSKKAGMGSGAGVLLLWWAQYFLIPVYKCIFDSFFKVRTRWLWILRHQTMENTAEQNMQKFQLPERWRFSGFNTFNTLVKNVDV